MKNSKTWFLLFLVLFCSSVSYSQKLTTGIYSGVNFSDIHGEEIGGKWQSKPGPVQGLYLGWSFGKSLGIQTGMNFSTVYYEHRTTYSPIFFFTPSYNDMYPAYYPAVEKMDFSFLRVPLLLTVSIPSALQFTMKAGIVFSFSQDHSLGSSYYYYPEPDNIKKKDFGYMFSSGISYPLSDKFKANFNVGYITGRKKFMEYSNYKNGSSEYTIGIEYEFIKKNKTNLNPKPESDSSSKKVTVTYYGGLNVSWNPSTVDGKKYSPLCGPLFGFFVNVPIGHRSSFISGVSFMRKGYSVKDSSSLFYRYLKDDKPVYAVDTKVQTDYAIIPFLINIPFGKSQKLFINTGPWLGLRLNARNIGVAYNEYRSEVNYTIQKTIIYDDIEKLLKVNDIGWIFGCGISLPVVNNYKIDIALQYSTCFKDVFNSSAEGYSQNTYDTDPVIRFRTVSLLLGFRIPYGDR
jgi:opacity protein-like surface antigen